MYVTSVNEMTVSKAIYYIGAVRIAVNTRLLIEGRLEGLGRFAFETLKRITESYPEHEFHFLFDRPFSDQFIFGSNVIPHVIHPPARHPILWHVWFELTLPKVLRKINPNVFLSPDGFLSLRADVVSLPVIHDLNFVHNPQDLARSHSWFYNRYFPKYAEKAKRIATVSQFSKNDLVDNYHIPEDRIDVVYNGVSERFSPTTPEDKDGIKAKWTVGRSYFVYVGSIHPRKNVVRMLLAYDQFRKSTTTDQMLLLVGNRKWWTADMQETLDRLDFKNDVVFTGRVSDGELQSLIGAATANIYVSTFEGFGIPIIEAFQAQVPVITSNVSSMPEIAGNAALLVDPLSVDSISHAMMTIVNDQELRDRLVKNGIERARDFTWDRTAQLLWNSLMKTVE